MLSKPVALGVLVVGCMTAAAGGAYIATRHRAEPVGTAPAAATFSEPASANAAPVASNPAPAAPAISTAPPSIEGPSAAAPAPLNNAKRRQVARTPIAEARPNQRDATPAEPAMTPGEPLASAGTPLPEPAASTPPAPEPAAQVRFEQLTVPADTVIGVQVDTAVNSERARVEDRVDGRVTRDVAVGGRVAIPAGTRLLGSVTLVERGGKFKDRARIAVRFHTAQLADGSRLPLQTTAIVREGDSPTGESAAKVGGAAVGGAILGAILGGGKGAMIGGSAGAAGGTAVVMAGDRNAATLPAGTNVTIRLMSDAHVSIEK